MPLPNIDTAPCAHSAHLPGGYWMGSSHPGHKYELHSLCKSGSLFWSVPNEYAGSKKPCWSCDHPHFCDVHNLLDIMHQEIAQAHPGMRLDLVEKLLLIRAYPVAVALDFEQQGYAALEGDHIREASHPPRGGFVVIHRAHHPARRLQDTAPLLDNLRAGHVASIIASTLILIGNGASASTASL